MAAGPCERAARTDVSYLEYPGQIHAFVSLTKSIPQGLACTLAIGDYLRREGTHMDEYAREIQKHVPYRDARREARSK